MLISIRVKIKFTSNFPSHTCKIKSDELSIFKQSERELTLQDIVPLLVVHDRQGLLYLVLPRKM